MFSILFKLKLETTNFNFYDRFMYFDKSIAFFLVLDMDEINRHDTRILTFIDTLSRDTCFFMSIWMLYILFIFKCISILLRFWKIIQIDFIISSTIFINSQENGSEIVGTMCFIDAIKLNLNLFSSWCDGVFRNVHVHSLQLHIRQEWRCVFLSLYFTIHTPYIFILYWSCRRRNLNNFFLEI